MGLILFAEPLFYEERRTYTRQVDCQGAIIAPGLIDIPVSYVNMALKRNAASTPFNISGIVMLLLCICIQINGAFGVDFSTDVKDAKTAEECLRKVGVGLLSHGKGTIIFVLLNDRATWGTNYILPYL